LHLRQNAVESRAVILDDADDARECRLLAGVEVREESCGSVRDQGLAQIVILKERSDPSVGDRFAPPSAG